MYPLGECGFFAALTMTLLMLVRIMCQNTLAFSTCRLRAWVSWRGLWGLLPGDRAWASYDRARAILPRPPPLRRRILPLLQTSLPPPLPLLPLLPVRCRASFLPGCHL